jgi:hypothetical protein
VIAEVAISGDETAHPGSVGGLHIAQVVTEIQAVGGIHAGQCGSVQHGFRVRFGMGAGVAADQAGGSLGVTQCLHQRQGESVRFVGDDAPG